MTIPTLHIKKGSAKPLYAGHPWVFAGGVARIEGTVAAGDEIRVVDANGKFLGRGLYSPDSAIPVRLIQAVDEPIGEELFAARTDAAIKLRKSLNLGAGEPTTAYRLINSEGDGLGGVTADVYGDYIAIQLGTIGMQRRLDTILGILEKRLSPRGILDRTAPAARKLEKLQPLPPVLRGAAPEKPFLVRENGHAIFCDLRAESGQKTGLFVDQRENRARFASFARGKSVLDVFSYTGGFALYAALAGAKEIALIESSQEALEGAKANLEHHRIEDADLIHAEWTDGFRHLRDAGRKFDLIALDPPKFAGHKAKVPEALSGYRDLNQQAARLLNPGGILFTCSCSGNVSELDFERAVAAGLHAAGRRSVLLERRGAACDHPSPPGFEQGRYLKCLVLAVE